MLSRGFLDSRPVDATTHPSDSLEVKLLKDEVNSLRAQVKEARIKITVLEKTCQQRSKGSIAEDGAGLNLLRYQWKRRESMRYTCRGNE